MDLQYLLDAAKVGDQQALGELLKEINIRTRPVATFRLQGSLASRVDDVMQEMNIIFYRDLHKIKDHPVRFVRKILIYLILNEYRRNRLTGFDDPNESGIPLVQTLRSEIDIEWAYEHKELHERIVKAYRRLTEKCSVIIGGLIQGNNIQETFQKVLMREPDLKRNSFDQRVFQCRKQLRRLLEAER
jgi:DNA-directed RNA polymerase specialized sigma24 family protein